LPCFSVICGRGWGAGLGFTGFPVSSPFGLETPLEAFIVPFGPSVVPPSAPVPPFAVIETLAGVK
jgi:hypothetical protein